ncbi:hypothetical protein AG1IA_08830 [Rhizoctonia solani AG-1 IA]|uniref:Uncharacterized protein n=1 Tax=Thanatephorus cucumeris (strain AG1-IA) TaxID=983506 RepID=L8WK07_THACA|nr:hypothetical protein AG1IA_08830 [Rhizoctonia solani AG-1 IA]
MSVILWNFGRVGCLRVKCLAISGQKSFESKSWSTRVWELISYERRSTRHRILSTPSYLWVFDRSKCQPRLDRDIAEIVRRTNADRELVHPSWLWVIGVAYSQFRGDYISRWHSAQPRSTANPV